MKMDLSILQKTCHFLGIPLVGTRQGTNAISKLGCASLEHEDLEGQKVCVSTTSQPIPSVVGISTSVPTETAPPLLVTPGHLLQSGKSAVLSSAPLSYIAHKDMEVVQVSPQMLSEHPVPVATEAQPPLLPLPQQSRPVYKVASGKKPVVGLRLFLEGKKCNRLAIHVQHLSSLTNIIKLASDDYDLNEQFLESVRWKKFSNLCSSVDRHDPNWIRGQESGGAFIVTSAQLVSKGQWPKTVLHLRLIYTYLPNCTIRKTEWA